MRLGLLTCSNVLIGILAMKNLLLLLLLAISLGTSCAENVSYDWLIAQYKKDMENDSITEYAEGRIDGEEYVVITVSRSSPTVEYEPMILVFRKTADRFEAIAKIDLQGDHSWEYGATIKNNSLFLEYWHAHHGWHGIRYQFKQINGKFRLIGGESRSMTLLDNYAGDEGSEDESMNTGDDIDDDYSPPDEVWSGISYNFRTSSALCYQEIVNSRNKKKYNEARRRFENWLLPKEGKRHQMKFCQIDLPLLDGFDFLDFSSPKSCYFDHKSELHLQNSER
jgi:hypothetical protein